MIERTVNVGGNTNFLKFCGSSHGCRAAGIPGIIHLFRSHYLNHEVGIINNAMIILELVQRHFTAFAGAAATAAEDSCTINHVANAISVETIHIRSSYIFYFIVMKQCTQYINS